MGDIMVTLWVRDRKVIERIGDRKKEKFNVEKENANGYQAYDIPVLEINELFHAHAGCTDKTKSCTRLSFHMQTQENSAFAEFALKTTKHAEFTFQSRICIIQR